MSTSAYKYTSDAGTTYQVFLADDFAQALGLSLASGTEPYLPPYVSPRYATYVASVPITWRQATISTQALFTNLPRQLAIGGVIYTLSSTQSESVFAIQGGSIMLAAGPQGPQGVQGATGPQGPAGFQTSVGTNISADVSLTANTPATIMSVTIPTGQTGTYQLMAVLTALGGGAASSLDAYTDISGSMSEPEGTTFVGASEYGQVHLLGQGISLTAGTVVSLIASSSAACTIKAKGRLGNGYSTQMQLNRTA